MNHLHKYLNRCKQATQKRFLYTSNHTSKPTSNLRNPITTTCPCLLITHRMLALSNNTTHTVSSPINPTVSPQETPLTSSYLELVVISIRTLNRLRVSIFSQSMSSSLTGHSRSQIISFNNNIWIPTHNTHRTKFSNSISSLWISHSSYRMIRSTVRSVLTPLKSLFRPIQEAAFTHHMRHLQMRTMRISLTVKVQRDKGKTEKLIC